MGRNLVHTGLSTGPVSGTHWGSWEIFPVGNHGQSSQNIILLASVLCMGVVGTVTCVWMCGDQSLTLGCFLLLLFTLLIYLLFYISIYLGQDVSLKVELSVSAKLLGQSVSEIFSTPQCHHTWDTPITPRCWRSGLCPHGAWVANTVTSEDSPS